MTQNPNLSLVVIFESDNPVEIELATAALEDAGIEFAVAAELPPGYGFGPTLSPVSRIQVGADSATRARDVVEGSFGGELEAEDGDGGAAV